MSQRYPQTMTTYDTDCKQKLHFSLAWMALSPAGLALITRSIFSLRRFSLFLSDLRFYSCSYNYNVKTMKVEITLNFLLILGNVFLRNSDNCPAQ